MGSMILKSALKTTTDVNDITTGLKTAHNNEKVQSGDSGGLKKAGKQNSATESSLKRTYDAISENGDTLEISEAGKKLGVQAHTSKDVGEVSALGKEIATNKKVSDITLAGYSEAKLKRLYVTGEITKQKYNRIIAKKASK